MDCIHRSASAAYIKIPVKRKILKLIVIITGDSMLTITTLPITLSNFFFQARITPGSSSR